jgi:hypothetical protein
MFGFSQVSIYTLPFETMSSPSIPAICDAVVRRGSEVTGPIRLPREDSQSFIEAFNRLYSAAGLSIAATLTPMDGSALGEQCNDAADRH